MKKNTSEKKLNTSEKVDSSNPKSKIPFFLNLSLKIRELKWSLVDKFYLNQKYRVAIALILTVGILSGLVYFSTGGTVNFNNKNKQNNSSNGSLSTDPDLERNLAKLNNIVDSYQPKNIVYDYLQYEDLPIYPPSWVGRNFTETEQKNALISGPEADADGDRLSNKLEYLFGSDPKNKYTLCGKDDGSDKCSKTDKENIDKGISPLTGFGLETNREIVLKKQDTVVLQSIQESFETASNEGVDFPILYQESNLIDISSQLDEETFITVEDNRESYTVYTNTRLDILDKFLSDKELDSSLNGLIAVYQTAKISELETLQARYTDLLKILKNVPVPITYTRSHQAFMLMFKKLIKLIGNRKDALNKKITNIDEFKAINKKLAVEVVWCYRKMNEELLKIDDSKK